MVIPVAVAAVSAFAGLLVAREQRRISALIPDAAELDGAVRSGDVARVASVLSATFPDDADVLSLALMTGGTSARAIATLNERLGDVERGLASRAGYSRTLARVALASGTLGAVLELSASVAGGGGAAVARALSAFVAGVLGVVVTVEIGRRTARAADRARAGWDAIAGVFSRQLQVGARAAGEPDPERTGRRAVRRGSSR